MTGPTTCNTVVLTEEDVPGAKFSHNNIAEHSVRELKRWLECRSLKRTGNKKDLVERCQNCIAAGRSQIIDVAVDRGKWFDMKINNTSTSSNNALHVTSGLPSTATSTLGYQLFPSVKIPEQFNKGHIYYYLIESPDLNMFLGSTQDSDSEAENGSSKVLSTEKPFRRGQQYIDSGSVGDLYDCYADNTYLVKSSIKSSFRNQCYDVRVQLSRFSGNIIHGQCECKASSLGRCSHVCALLLSVLKHIEAQGFNALTCTSKPCTWGKGSLKRTPQKIVDAEYPSVINRIRRATFDPRPTKYCKSEATSEEVNNFLSLFDCNVRHDRPTYWQEILKYSYSDFSLTSEDSDILIKQCQKFMSALEEHAFEKQQDSFLVPNTEKQSLSNTWAMWRSILVTASTARELIGLQQPGAKMNFLKKHLWNLNKITTKGMSYGLKHEAAARETYISIKKIEFKDLHVVTTGLWMCKKYPQFGCSPDGLVFRNGLRGILEIKCPILLEKFNPKDFSTVLSPSQRSSFFLKLVNGDIKVKENHVYYMQVQLTMAITQTTFCDFFVWSPNGFVAIEIPFEGEFCRDAIARLTIIHRQLIVPEYFLMRTVRDLKPINLIY